MNLVEYVVNYTERGECNCGQCLDRGNKPDPEHSVDNGFFKVAIMGTPTKEKFIELTGSHQGEFGEVDPLDGKEHGYMELGGWIGDQGLALQYMSLGALLGVFRLLTPRVVLGDSATDELVQRLAGAGYITVVKK